MRHGPKEETQCVEKCPVAGLATMALSTGGTLSAVASPAFASSGGTISVAYQNYGTNLTV